MVSPDWMRSSPSRSLLHFLGWTGCGWAASSKMKPRIAPTALYHATGSIHRKVFLRPVNEESIRWVNLTFQVARPNQRLTLGTNLFYSSVLERMMSRAWFFVWKWWCISCVAQIVLGFGISFFIDVIHLSRCDNWRLAYHFSLSNVLMKSYVQSFGISWKYRGHGQNVKILLFKSPYDAVLKKIRQVISFIESKLQIYSTLKSRFKTWYTHFSWFCFLIPLNFKIFHFVVLMPTCSRVIRWDSKRLKASSNEFT